MLELPPGFSLDKKGTYRIEDVEEDIGEAHHVATRDYFRRSYPVLLQSDPLDKYFGLFEMNYDEPGINKAYRLLSTAFSLINKIHKKAKDPRIALPKTIEQISFPDGFLNNTAQVVLKPELFMDSIYYPIYKVIVKTQDQETTLIKRLEVELFRQNQGIGAKTTAAAIINDAVLSVIAMNDELSSQNHKPNLQSIGYCEFYPGKVVLGGTIDYYVAVRKEESVTIGEVSAHCKDTLLAQLTDIKIT